MKPERSPWTTGAGKSSRISSTSIRRWVDEDQPSIIGLIKSLVRLPSRGGIDPHEPIVERIERWCTEHDLPIRHVRDTVSGQTVGIVCDIPGTHPGPRYVLNACVDTAPFGDPTAWRHPPTSAAVEGGWLYGRGAADSKAAIAIFLNIAARLRSHADELHGTLTLLFDADEHTGRFGGAKNYFGGPDAPNDIAGVMIGYPGMAELVVGGRGFLRADITVRGQAGHTGSRRAAGNDNAVEKASQLVCILAGQHQPGPVDPSLGLPPKLTVTRINGGESFSIIPDQCTVSVDARLTTDFAADATRALIEHAAVQIDERWPASRPTTVTYHESWPAYALSETSPLRLALLGSARRYLSEEVTANVAGPSNIGNYLASIGIEATAGLGVRYEGLHGTDERIDLDTVSEIEATYLDAVLELLTP